MSQTRVRTAALTTLLLSMLAASAYAAEPAVAAPAETSTAAASDAKPAAGPAAAPEDGQHRFNMNQQTGQGGEAFDEFLKAQGISVAQGAPSSDDADADGVSDDQDQCADSIPGQMIGKDGCPVDVAIDLRGVNFESSRAVLLAESVRNLRAAAGILRKFDTIRVEIGGHTDASGPDDLNQRLSEQRAKVVYDWLVRNGIAAKRLSWKGYGESSPIADNESAAGKAKNRRTELVILN